jgi:hypothetical protein
MQTLRNATLIARFVLVWFALFVGASVASPIVKPGDVHMVCSGSGGMKIVVSADDDGTVVKVTTNMDCPLCASVTATAPKLELSFSKPSPLAHALHPIAAAHIASASAPPIPSRGPPEFSL